MINVYNRDCIEGMSEIPDLSIDAMITDPPYGISKKQDRGERKLRSGYVVKKNFGEWDELEGDSIYEWLPHAIPKIKNWAIVFCGENSISRYIEIFLEHGWRANCGCWIKNASSILNGKVKFVSSWEPLILAKRPGSPFYAPFRSNVWKYPQQDQETRIHPNQKPIDLIIDIMECVTQEGDTVLEPFLGSGTTAVASQKLNRNCIGFEREVNFFEGVQARLKKREAAHIQTTIDGGLRPVIKTGPKDRSRKRLKDIYQFGEQTNLGEDDTIEL